MFMRTSGGDAFVSDRGSSLHVEGSATKSGAPLRFRWSFRQTLGYSGCAMITLQGGQTQTVAIEIRGAVLFTIGSTTRPSRASILMPEQTRTATARSRWLNWEWC